MIDIRVPENLIPIEILGALQEEQLDKLTKQLADSAHSEWMRLASAKQSTFRQDYLRGIQQPVVMRGTAVISLVGSVANMMEHGRPKEDLRDILLGPDVPLVPPGARGKHEALAGGEYRYIPFRHAGPGAGMVVGQAMGKAYTGHQAVADAKKLGREVYGRVRKLKSYQDPRAKPEEVRLGAGLAPKLRDHHKTDIYAGMVRMEKTYAKATQSQYFTFRTISTHYTDKAGDRQRATVGWKRKALPAWGLAQKVADYVAKIAADAARAMLEVGA